MKRRSFVGKTLVRSFAALVPPEVLSANENRSFSKIHTPLKVRFQYVHGRLQLLSILKS